MEITYNFSCDECGCKEYLEAENEYEKVLICKNCAKGYVVEQKKIRPAMNVPQCPTCGSTKIEKIGTVERATSIIGLGLLSKKINKTYKCLNCKYTW